MSSVLAISSRVASGHVGLSAVEPALHMLGHEVIALPTVILSNHPGHPHVAGFRVNPADLLKMADALDANDRLTSVETVLTGYLPSPDHVAAARAIFERVKAHNPAAELLCDPVLGDDPKGLYIDEAAAIALRDNLLPLAAVAFPNRFELQWLSGKPVADAAQAVSAARALPCPTTIATSIPQTGDDGRRLLATIEITSQSAGACLSTHRDRVPNGTGDLLAGLYAADRSLPNAVARIDHVIRLSESKPELALIEAAATWRNCPPAVVFPVSTQTSR